MKDQGFRSISVAAISGLALAAGVGAGVWLERQKLEPVFGTAAIAAPTSAPSGERQILYYKDPMGMPDYSPVPKKDSMGMDYIPVYADEDAAKPAPQQVASPPKREQKPLYYRNPMGLADTSPTPKKPPTKWSGASAKKSWQLSDPIPPFNAAIRAKSGR